MKKTVFETVYRSLTIKWPSFATNRTVDPIATRKRNKCVA